MKIIKSFRKTIAMSINKNGELIIKAPYFTSDKTIKLFVEKHIDWINKRQENIKATKKDFLAGEELLLLGERYYIDFDINIKKTCINGNKIIFKKEVDVKNELVKFCKIKAKNHIETRIDYISGLIGIKYNTFKINSAKTRWGSCNSKKNLNFSFRLIMAPETVIDYVIIHELSHIKEMNHSKDFWNLVDDNCCKIGITDYKKERKWLKDNGSRISYI